MPEKILHPRPGDELQFDEHDWAPLEQALSFELAHAFMWMHRFTLPDGTVVHAYKHHDTRRYLFLDTKLRAYRYTGLSSYVRQDLGAAIVDVFLDPTIQEDDRCEAPALVDALRRAWIPEAA